GGGALGGSPDRRLWLADGRTDRKPSGTRSRRSGPRQSRLRPVLGGTQRRGARSPPASASSGTQSPALLAAARAPRGATPPRRRATWLRIFVVRCSLPCDPSGWGSFMQWKDDTTLSSRGLGLRPIGKSSGSLRITAGSEAVRLRTSVCFSGLPLKADK